MKLNECQNEYEDEKMEQRMNEAEKRRRSWKKIILKEAQLLLNKIWNEKTKTWINELLKCICDCEMWMWIKYWNHENEGKNHETKCFEFKVKVGVKVLFN